MVFCGILVENVYLSKAAYFGQKSTDREKGAKATKKRKSDYRKEES